MRSELAILSVLLACGCITAPAPPPGRLPPEVITRWQSEQRQRRGSDIPDTAVRDCVIDKFETFVFPAPDGGIVTVVYPIMLAPG